MQHASHIRLHLVNRRLLSRRLPRASPATASFRRRPHL